MSKYNKLWSYIGGSAVGLVFGVLAWKGLATCTDETVLATCSLYGLTPATVNAIFGQVFGGIGLVAGPANKA